MFKSLIELNYPIHYKDYIINNDYKKDKDGIHSVKTNKVEISGLHAFNVKFKTLEKAIKYINECRAFDIVYRKANKLKPANYYLIRRSLNIHKVEN